MKSDKPAFPQLDGFAIRDDAPYIPSRSDGLSRRELFAAMAMQGILAGLPPTANYCVSETTRTAIEHADALIAELDKVES